MHMRATQSKMRQAASRLRSTIEGLNRAVIGRSEITRQLMFALVTKHHMLLEGPPGVAKSFMASLLFGAVRGASTFHVSCTRKMSEDYIVGPLDMRKFREEGCYEHRIEGSIVTSDFAFVDEFLDLSPNTLRALLEVLNERTFTRGVQKVRSNLWTAIACTNFSGDNDEALEAVLDRFLFKARLEPLSNKKDRVRMLRGDACPEVPPVSFRDIRFLHRMMKKVSVPEHVLECYVSMCETLPLTDRYMKQALDVVRAQAAIEGRMSARISDLSALDACFVRTGDTTSAQAWAAAYSRQYKHALSIEERLIDLTCIAVRTHELRQMADECQTYEEIHAIAVEAREAEAARAGLSIPQSAQVDSRIKHRCEAIFTLANKLYAEQLSTTATT